MSSSDVQNSINQMNAFVIALARYSFPIIFTFGVVCNLLNVYVFTRPNLRTNPCCMYFLSSSIAALLFTVFNFPLRTLQLGYSIDPTIDSQIFCQLKSYLTFSWRALAIWFLVLASVDRFLHSSTQANIRKLSSFRIARCSIPVTIILIHAAYSHIPVFYGIVLPRRSCTVDNSSYGFFLGIWHLVMYGLGPPLLMLTFSLLTIQHISRRKILPIAHSNTAQPASVNKEKNLVRMALFQSLIVGLTTTAYAICQLYIIFTADQVKDRLQLAIDNVFINLIGAISGAGHSMTFFIFTLTSRMFRQQISCRHRIGDH